MRTSPLADRLLVGPAATIWSSPASGVDLLRPLPDGVSTVDRPEDATVALVFATRAAAVRRVLEAHGDGLARPDALWVAYPKARSSRLDGESLPTVLADHGLRAGPRVSVDELWWAVPVGRDDDGP
jgi:hypothetical protein